jgi:hypothetical protein
LKIAFHGAPPGGSHSRTSVGGTASNQNDLGLPWLSKIQCCYTNTSGGSSLRSEGMASHKGHGTLRRQERHGERIGSGGRNLHLVGASSLIQRVEFSVGRLQLPMCCDRSRLLCASWHVRISVERAQYQFSNKCRVCNVQY